MNKLFLFICLTLMAAACKKDDPKPEALPPVTQSGKNTFGCYLNGKIWVPYSPNTFDRNLTPVFGDTWNILAIRNMKSDGSDIQSIKFSIMIDWDNPLKTYKFNEDVGAIYKDDGQGCEYYGDPGDISEGTFTITKLDLEEKVWAGTFEFTLGTEGCETIKVTDGRFDIKIP